MKHQGGDVKSRITELYYNILLCDITTEYQGFMDACRALAMLIETTKPDSERKLVEQINEIANDGYLAEKNISRDKFDYRSSIACRRTVISETSKIDRQVKASICDLLTKIIIKEKILQE